MGKFNGVFIIKFKMNCDVYMLWDRVLFYLCILCNMGFIFDDVFMGLSDFYNRCFYN